MNKQKRIAVLGANGYIGKHIVNYLINTTSHSIECYDIAQYSELPNYQYIDVTNKDSIKSLNLDVDYVYMFAGLTGTYAGFNSYRQYISVNELGLLNLLDEIRHSIYRPKVIFPSTRLVYKGYDRPLKEDDEKDIKTIYAANKLSCEGYLQAYHDSFDIPYSVFRICVPYGNMLSTDYSFGTVGFFIKQALTGNDIILYGNGSNKRTFTHMEDLCYQIVEASIKKESDAQIYNVGGEILSIRQVAEIIANKFGTNVVCVPWPEKDLRIESGHTYFDDSKIQRLLGGVTYKRIEDFSKDI